MGKGLLFKDRKSKTQVLIIKITLGVEGISTNFSFLLYTPTLHALILMSKWHTFPDAIFPNSKGSTSVNGTNNGAILDWKNGTKEKINLSHSPLGIPGLLLHQETPPPAFWLKYQQ